ncbi:MAG: acyl carrier protein [Candidatus Thorarchaeota archaeon]|nr:acyl carrier protein [Candidatus Thorarchaeota archaeon]
MSSNLDRLDEIISKVLLVRKDEISDNLRRKEHEAWDSMAHVVLVSEIESEFGVFFQDEEVVEILTVGDLRKTLAKKLDGQNV